MRSCAPTRGEPPDAPARQNRTSAIPPPARARGRGPVGCGRAEPPFRAYVTNETAGTLSVIDGDTFEVSATIGLGKRPRGVQPSRDGRFLYVALSGSVGERPWGIALSPDDTLLFTANGPSNDVSVVDTRTRSVLRKTPVGERPWGVAVIERAPGVS